MSEAPDARAGTTANEDVGAAELRILTATERLLEQTTARDLSVAMVLAEASVARGTFYHHFSSKWEVIQRLVVRTLDEILGRIGPLLGPGSPQGGPEALRSSIAEGCRIWSEHRAVLRAVAEHWRELPELRDVWLTVADRFITVVAAVIERERAAGGAGPGTESRRSATVLVWSTAYCLYLAGLDEIRDMADEHALEAELVHLWTSSIYGEAAAG